MDIVVENLVKTFGRQTALNIDSCTIPSGQLVGLVGNNGAGKTTWFRLVMDLLRPDQGTVRFGNHTVGVDEDWKLQVAAFIDAGFLIDFLTPEEYFGFVGRLYGLSGLQVEQRLEGFIRFMGNEILGQKKFIRNFSAGNRQKIGIVGALLVEPPLVILDEPFNFLDPSSQLLIRNLLADYNQRTGATVWVSSHNLNHIADLCQRVILLKDGEILQDLDNRDKKAEEMLLHYFSVV